VTPLAVQSAHRQRPGDETLAESKPPTLCWFTLTELEATRRVLEAPLGSLSRMTRSTLLVAQGAYLRRLYYALVAQVGEAAALAEFTRLLASVG
jgi:hypothetical protein